MKNFTFSSNVNEYWTEYADKNAFNGEIRNLRAENIEWKPPTHAGLDNSLGMCLVFELYWNFLCLFLSPF